MISEQKGIFKILIVDDLINNLIALEGLLQRDDVEIFKALSGTEALEYMVNHDFALALIDVKMPVMSGFELAELMRGTNRTKNIPIIFVTATAKDQSFAFNGYESGAVDFLLKPLDTHAVKSKVNIFIELFRHKKEQEDLLISLKKTQEELRLAKDSAEKANYFKTAFLANMSHEIRTPLGAMLGFADLLRNDKLPLTERKSFLEIIRRNGENLLVIINDVLDLSKVEAGRLVLEYTDTYPEKIAFDVILLLEETAKKKGLLLEYVCDDTTPKQVVTDPTRVRQILLNLVGNSIKFTQTGSVKIKCFGRKDVTGSESLFFEITDTGIGIAEAQKINVFEVFAQADETTTRRFGGSGLGLPLARKLARSLGGDITILESSLNKGSTFLVQIESQPKLRSSDSDRNSKDMARLDESHFDILMGLKVLVVDDSPDNQFLISRYLLKYGVLVDSAENGLLGYQKAIAGDFALILMDIQMPEMDGYTATRNLRKAGYKKPIIALSAHAMSEVKQQCIAAGYTAYLTKPIKIKELIATIVENLK